MPETGGSKKTNKKTTKGHKAYEKNVLALVICMAGAGVLLAADYGAGGFDTCNVWDFNTCTYDNCWYSYDSGGADYPGYCAWNPNGNNNNGECDCVI